VRALKAYLEYAETKGRAVAHSPTGTPDSDFETEVADRLRMRGYKVDLQVGVSRQEERGKSFRIDLAVWHPDSPEHYLAGIECDGAAYHSSKSARDRDRLREDVLNSLGWQLVRVWSTDWFDNPSKETDKLVAKLEQLRMRPVSEMPSYPSLHRASAIVDPEAVEKAAKATSEEAPPAREPTLEVVKPAPLPSQAKPAFDGTALLKGTGKLTPAQAVAALEAYRDIVIAPASANWEPERSLLRPAMIETFVQQRITDPNQWYAHVPQFLRQGTNGAEKKRYLEDVCALLERL
jgi:very-short-patch-repair endonuclease